MITIWNETTEIRGALRQLARKYPIKNAVLMEAIHPTEKGVRGGKQYVCNKCGLNFPLKDVQVDHIEPVIPVDREIEKWDEYIERLFCGPEELQVLCKECHVVKSNRENEERSTNL